MEKITLVNAAQLKTYLEEKAGEDEISQFYDFGKSLVEQALSLRAMLDAKLMGCLGWSAGLLAVVLLGGPGWHGASERAAQFLNVVAIVSAALAMAGVVTAFLGMRSRPNLLLPSEKDWFRQELFGWPAIMRKHHTLALLDAHRSVSVMNLAKEGHLHASELLLVAAALLVGALAIFRFAVAG